jgi:uncharacterized protein YjiS (DUF1127 family)
MTALAVTSRVLSSPTFGNVVTIWLARIRSRRELWRLLRDKPELLADIGLTPELAHAECGKHFWQASRNLPGRRRSAQW